jgi:AraC-like DNA-binding protein
MYLDDGLSIREMSKVLDLPRRHISTLLKDAGVVIGMRGKGRARPNRRTPVSPTFLTDLRELYELERLNRRQVADKLAVSEWLVRSRFADAGVKPRTKGRGDRQDRQRPAAERVEKMYVESELTAQAVGAALGYGLRAVLATAHEHNLPVRPGGGASQRYAVSLLTALYDDPDVFDTLTRHQVPLVRTPGTITERFPDPAPLTRGLLHDLYERCGLAMTHIELVTGHPAATVRGALARHGIRCRASGGLSPFMRRQRRDVRQ